LAFTAFLAFSVGEASKAMGLIAALPMLAESVDGLTSGCTWELLPRPEAVMG
jgi:hypothetical protein